MKRSLLSSATASAVLGRSLVQYSALSLCTMMQSGRRWAMRWLPRMLAATHVLQRGDEAAVATSAARSNAVLRRSTGR